MKFPYQKMGYSKEEAAVHLLNRFTFGIAEGDIDVVLKMGHEKWFETQLKGGIADNLLNEKLNSYPAINMTSEEISKKFLLPAQVRRLAEKDGIQIGDDPENLKNEDRARIKEYLDKNNIQLVRELERQTTNQKILRAIYTKNQLHEVLTDFWFNHFNVFMGKNTTSKYVLSYERDVIRPNVVGKFEDLLVFTAQSPAMLTYLDNFSSTKEGFSMNPNRPNNNNAKGLNENYAREVMELHTLGVDGGYTQADVTNAAKVLTGWTLHPKLLIQNFDEMAKLAKKFRKSKSEMIEINDFVFSPERHEPGSKLVLNNTYQEGYEGGLQLLKDLASHNATAYFISKKIATKFLNDNPDEMIIKQMAEVFKKQNGSITAVLSFMVQHDAFWDKSNQLKKIKSPFEYTVSAVRATGATVVFPYALATKIEKMGQKLYFYQAPTGFPDKGLFWINSGLLLQRLNFGIDLANNKIGGVKVNPLKMLHNHEPESLEDALNKIFAKLLPTLDSDASIEKLLAVANTPEFENKIKEKAIKKDQSEMEVDQESNTTNTTMEDNNKTLAQALGIIIGSPNFQRR